MEVDWCSVFPLNGEHQAISLAQSRVEFFFQAFGLEQKADAGWGIGIGECAHPYHVCFQVRDVEYDLDAVFKPCPDSNLTHDADVESAFVAAEGDFLTVVDDLLDEQFGELRFVFADHGSMDFRYAAC